MSEDREALVLERPECVSLLAATTLGRVVICVEALPDVQPVSYVLDGNNVLFRTTDGSKLDAATRNAIVAFQADNLQRGGERSWTVTVVGRAEVVTDPGEITRLSTLALPAWVADEPSHYVRIRMEVVQGRHLWD